MFWVFISILAGGGVLGFARRIFARVMHLFRATLIASNVPSHTVSPTTPTSFSSIFIQRQHAATAPTRETIWPQGQTFIFQETSLDPSQWIVDPTVFSTFFAVGKVIYSASTSPNLSKSSTPSTSPSPISPTSPVIHDEEGCNQAKKLLWKLWEQSGNANGDIDFAKTFGKADMFHGLVWLGEQRARLYPPQVQTPNTTWFDIPVEGYAGLCGVSTNQISALAGNEYIVSDWAQFVDDIRKDKTTVGTFGKLMGRIFGGNHALLAHRVRRERTWNPTTRHQYDLIVQQILFNMALCCEFTPELLTDIASLKLKEEQYSDWREARAALLGGGL
jgi:hypothetical protein